MVDSVDPFDVGMETGMDAGPTLNEGVATPANPTPATPAPETFIEAGGRKFPNQGELAKAYTALLKDYSREKGNQAKNPWLEFGRRVDAHPELRDSLQKQINEYAQRVQAGQPSATAQRATGLPDAVVAQMTTMESKLQDMALKDEIRDLRGANPDLDDETMNAVLKESYEHGGLPLEKALKIVRHDTLAATAQAKAEKSVKDAAAAKKRASVGSPAVPNVSPSQKSPQEMSPDEERKAILAKLFPEKYGSVG